MTARDLIQRYIKKKEQAKFSVLALIPSGSWWHVHLDEELPQDNIVVLSAHMTERAIESG